MSDTENNIKRFLDEYQKSSPAMRLWLEDTVRSKIKSYLDKGEIDQDQYEDAIKGVDEMIDQARQQADSAEEQK
jgi:serine protease inhibitor